VTQPTPKDTKSRKSNTPATAGTGPVDISGLHISYHGLIENSSDAMILLEREGARVLDANPAALHLFGLDNAALLQRSLETLCPALQSNGTDSGEHVRAMVEQVRDGVGRVFEVCFEHASGRSFDCELRIVVLPLPGQRLLHARLIDITRRKMDEALRTGQGHLLEMVARGAPLAETLDRLMLLIEGQSDGVYCSVLLLDDDGVRIHPGGGPSLPREYMDALDGFPIGPEVGSCGTAMYRKEPVIVTDIMNDPLWAPYKGLIEPHGFRACWSTPIFLKREQVLGSFAMYYKEVRSPQADDMRLITVATHLAGIAIERTRRERELATYRDRLEELVAARTDELTKSNHDLASAIDDLNKVQVELVRRGKLAALGALVAGVAHELNTPIGNSLITATTMADHTGRLAASLSAGLKRSTLDAYLNEAHEAGNILVRNLQRAADLVLSFKEVAADQAGSQRRHFSLTEMLAEITPALSVEAKHQSVTMVQSIEPGLQMDSYPGPLTQVLGNLIENCLMHAFGDGRAGTIVVTAHAQDGGIVGITVEDDGSGIAPEHMGRVFDPFFTSKMGAGGTGLGLHVVHNIVTGILGGRIDLASTVDAGTRFTLLLPAVAPQFVPSSPGLAAAGLPAQTDVVI
jgi:PAS domain S-box-containing protein